MNEINWTRVQCWHEDKCVFSVECPFYHDCMNAEEWKKWVTDDE